MGNNTSAGLIDLSDGVTYYWQVRALNAHGMIEADNGAWWRFTVDTLPPVAFFKVKPPNGAIDPTGP